MLELFLGWGTLGCTGTLEQLELNQALAVGAEPQDAADSQAIGKPDSREIEKMAHIPLEFDGFVRDGRDGEFHLLSIAGLAYL